MPRLGIGITTYNRASHLADTLDAVARHTTAPHVLVVADDGSTDETRALLRRRRVPHLAGVNRGIAWNKNRALFHLHAVAGCDVVILLEDDTMPIRDGWERPWIEAADWWGHANFAGEWFAGRILSGSGTPEDPFFSPMISGQCVTFARRALHRVGYMDTRFGRYGFEHCDHSERMLEAGFGGRSSDPPLYVLLKGDLRVSVFEPGDYRDELERNALVYLEVQQSRRRRCWPWRTHTELRSFVGEMRAAELYDGWMRVRRAWALAGAAFRWQLETRLQRVLAAMRRRLGFAQAPRGEAAGPASQRGMKAQ